MARITGPPAYLAQVPPDRQRQYGLQSQAIVTTEVEDAEPSYALRGAQHEVNNCGRLGCWSHDCDEQDGDKFADQPGQTWVSSTPFTVTAVGPPCGGRHAIDNARRRATERLVALEWNTVERAVLTGMCGASPYLIGPAGDGDITLVISPAGSDSTGYTALAEWNLFDTSFRPELPAGTDPVTREQALGYLEWGFREYGGPGVIHAPSYTYPWFHDWILREQSRLVTQIGTGWAFGRGYWSVAPGDPDPIEPDVPDMTSAWLYGTGAVRIWRSQIIYPAGNDGVEYDWRQNRSMALAERSYTVSMQCPYVAVNVDLNT